jgi:hypothetical protein
MKVIAVMKLIHRNGSCLMNCTYNRIIKIIRLFGFRIGLLYVIRAKILRDNIADAILWLSLRGERILEKKRCIIRRNKVFMYHVN